MKIVISAQDDQKDSLIDQRFGRARYFLFFDTDSGEFRSQANTLNLNAAQGSGVQSAANVARMGADFLITGHCGPKAFDVLKAAGIQVVLGVSGKASEAVEALKSGTLTPATTPDVAGHWNEA